MKKNAFYSTMTLFVVIIFAFLQGCQSDLDDFSNDFSDDIISEELLKDDVNFKMVNEDELNLKMVNELTLSNYEYKLNITKKEAEKIGIPNDKYEEVKEEIDNINFFIKEFRKTNPKDELILPEPGNIIVKSSIPLLKRGSEEPGEPIIGTFSINVMTGGSTSFYVPTGYHSLDVTVTAKGAWGSYRITVTSGDSTTTKGVIYIPYTDNTATFTLDYSGSGVSAGIDVSGPNGVANWELYIN